MSDVNNLFFVDDLRKFLEQKEKEFLEEIDNFESDYILNTNIDELKNHLKEKYFLEIPEIKDKNICLKQEERTNYNHLNNNKYSVVLNHVPFSGNEELFRYIPSTYNYDPPIGRIRENEIIVEINLIDKNKESLNNEFNNRLNEIKKWLSWVSKDTTDFNNSLEQKIYSKIKDRCEKLKNENELISSLGFPLKKREDTPKTYIVPEIKRKINPFPPIVKSSSKPEPIIKNDDYEHILNVVRNMSLVMERSPKIFKEMDEETLRSHFLIQLNGHYEGMATGETFNYEGKTDILIRYEGKNIFVCECKIWDGKKLLLETINQILRYTAWRDTKTAIFLFNRNKDLSSVLSQIPSVVKEHPNFKKEEDYDSETGFRYIFTHKDDKNKELYLTILVFDIPK